MSSYFKKQTIKYFVHAGQLQMLYPCQLFTVLRTTFILSLLFETVNRNTYQGVCSIFQCRYI